MFSLRDLFLALFTRRSNVRKGSWFSEEMDIPGECGTPVCMPATWKMLKKRFLGKIIQCISTKKHILRYMLVGCSRELSPQTGDLTAVGMSSKAIMFFNNPLPGFMNLRGPKSYVHARIYCREAKTKGSRLGDNH